MKITQWHQGTDKPVRDGVYQRSGCFGVEYSRFKNGIWMFHNFNYEKASKETWHSLHQELPWRGITKP